MKLGFIELVRRPGRFATVGVILTLIAVLLMFLGGLLDGLLRNATGAIRAQNAQALVYSDTAQASLARSRIDPELRAVVDEIDGVFETGGFGLVQLGARVPGNGPRDLANVAVFGFELAPVGVPGVPPVGQGYADETLRADGIEVDMVIELGPARSPVEIIGFVSDTSYAGQGALWVAPETWRTTLAANRPDAQLDDGVFQALVVQGVPDVASRIDRATDGRTDSYSIADAVEAIPGVSEQRTTFNQIIGVTIVIALVVVVLFFALITVERVGLYGVFKALGARSSTIFVGLVTQAVSVTLVACAVATVLTVVLDLLIPPGAIPLDVTSTRIVTSIALLIVAAIVGCSFSLRRVLRVDPASAIGA